MPHALVFVLRLLQEGRPIGYYHEKMTAHDKHVIARQPLWAGVAALRVFTCHILAGKQLNWVTDNSSNTILQTQPVLCWRQALLE